VATSPAIIATIVNIETRRITNSTTICGAAVRPRRDHPQSRVTVAHHPRTS
jgi:hypothetical protein